jgi:2-oxoglutarate dehydrogenase E1 component
MDVDEQAFHSEALGLAEELYAQYLLDPQTVPPGWREYFAAQPVPDTPARGPGFAAQSIFSPPEVHATGSANGQVAQAYALQDRVDQVVRAYRVSGHLAADIDPLRRPRPAVPHLDPGFYGFTDADLERTISSTSIAGPQRMTLRQAIEHLRNTYCRSIGVQFMNIDDTAIRLWLTQRMERVENRMAMSREQRIATLTKLTDAVIFEDFVQKKYLGAKRFSLEGGESLIPVLHLALEKAGQMRINGVVIGMAHRGRLNVLVNIIGKSAWEVFREFEDTSPVFEQHRGDVKYHLGYSTTWRSAAGHEIHVSLCFNPSHLEFVNPMALGRTRANLDFHGACGSGMAILVHGDAAFAGQGVVQEVLNMSQLRGYSTCGTIHIILNNQVGFTTDPQDSRSSLYASGVARMLQIPIFHVNGEDPEAVEQVIDMAMDFRARFQRDVVIDMYCYRRRGHNEGDEPSFTQPQMYQAIAKRKTVLDGYVEQLAKLGTVTVEQAAQIAHERRAQLEHELDVARDRDQWLQQSPPGERWMQFHGGPESQADEVQTGVDAQKLSALLEAALRLPEGFTPHPKIVHWLEQRRAMARGEQPLDWAAAEELAFASLATQYTRVRLSGQDSERGTFSHRHLVLHDYKTGERYTPLQHLAAHQAPVEVYNSPLSETGVLGFEYGYTLDCPVALVLWEAQFGDFCNVAQPIIDQFIAGAEEKWGYLSALVLLLPHGFEGQGSEHSSARLERFLQLAAADNMQIVNLTTPAQYFHCLRRQVLRQWRKPLVVMAPKSLLRHPQVVSSLGDLEHGSFRRILHDPHKPAPKKVRRILLCSGKLYYELNQARLDLGREDVAILRIEQLYPLPEALLDESLKPYTGGTPALWVQEEPENMGAWHYLKLRFGDSLLGRFPLAAITRLAAPSPATGSHKMHKLEQDRIIETAFEGMQA